MERKEERSKMFLVTELDPNYITNDFNLYLQNLLDFKYALWQIEENSFGTHLQMFLEFKTPKTIKDVRGAFSKAFVMFTYDRRRGIEYCKKEPRVSGPYEVESN